ncbi:MAG TPA: GNAT family N-acetyltransferase [Paludibacter sp.]|nr:GNAT family N-acetyltransferase [Paludibacter sp.]HOS45506.1 GNAT family N-acetyltransferase [Paludibacter sp.]HPM10044.1 GNAT family N-acetyltransferase [Paludibacter sp.]
MTIRQITTFDQKTYQAIINLLPQLDDSVAPPSEDYLKNMLASGHSHLFVAVLEDNNIAGMLTLVEYSVPTGKKLWIEDVVVDISQRGKGLGKQLLLHAIQFAKTRNAKTIILTSRPHRIAANKLYQRIGFIQRETNVYAYSLK